MIVSVILSTYQNPEWLKKVLWGYATQTRRPDEILIADDGSTQETAAVIKSVRQETRLPVVHVWQPDEGFRKCTILNRAIVHSRGDYLIFSDGDCIPRHDFVATHDRLARPYHFLSGGRLQLPHSTSQRIRQATVVGANAFSPTWLLRNGAGIQSQLRLLSLPARAAAVADQVTSTHATFNGHNTSAWKSDILSVNGFDERMRYGGLDRELGERLTNAGVTGLQVRHRAVCVRLHHAMPQTAATSLETNDAIRDQVHQRRLTRTEHGIVQPSADRGESDAYVVEATLPGGSTSDLLAQLKERAASLPINPTASA